jgi:hypothetical protein
MIIEQQRKQPIEAEISVMTSVLSATTTCKFKLAMLEAVIQRAKKAGGDSNKVTKSTRNFKPACKKKDIEDPCKWISTRTSSYRD